MNSTKRALEGIATVVVWEICKFWILQNLDPVKVWVILFERYVNFEFYKTQKIKHKPITEIIILIFWVISLQKHAF